MSDAKAKRDAIALHNALTLANRNAEALDKLEARVLALERILATRATSK